MVNAIMKFLITCSEKLMSNNTQVGLTFSSDALKTARNIVEFIKRVKSD